MKLTKLTLSIVGGLALTVLMVGLTFAAPASAAHLALSAMLDLTITPTVTVTPTVTITPTATPVPTVTMSHTHPVALAISLYFHLPYTAVMALHDSGVGFGVIARAYMTARASNGVLSPTQVLAMFRSGMGWGQFMRQYGIHPGGNGLGAIMSGRTWPIPTPVPGTGSIPNRRPALNSPGQTGPAARPGNSCNAPGHNKPGKPPKK